VSSVWFFLLGLMLALYAILDGWDLGVGVIYLFLARTNSQRRLCLNAIGPLWNGNEVWLLFSGGALFMAFPRVYAVSFSGFYLPLMLVLWLLIGRGVSLELRGEIDNALWRSFWDICFAAASTLLALLFGVALGNVIGGLPLQANGAFQGTFSLLLNIHSVVVGLFAVALLALHGANFLCWRTEGTLHDRSREISRRLLIPVCVLAAGAPLAAHYSRPGFMDSFARYPVADLAPLLVLILLTSTVYFSIRGRDSAAFFSGGTLILTLLASAATSVYPYLLYSNINPAYSLTVTNASAPYNGLVSGLIAVGIPMLAVIVYQVVIHRLFFQKLTGREKDGY